MTFTYVTVTRNYDNPNGTDPAGYVTFTPAVPMVNDGVTIAATTVRANLNIDAVISVSLAATTDPDTLPTTATYLVTEKIVGQTPRQYYVAIPHDAGSTVDLGELDTLNAVPPKAAALAQHIADTDPHTGLATTEDVRDLIGSTLVAGTGLSKTVSDVGNTVTLDVATAAFQTYNLRPDNAKELHAGIGRARAGTGLCRIVLIGDSFSNGHPYGRGAFDQGTHLVETLHEAGWRVGELVHLIHQTDADARIVRSGSWTDGNQTDLYVTRSGSGASLTYASRYAGTAVEIVTRGGTAAFTVTIDGVSHGAITPAGGSAPQLVTIEGLTDTTHTVVISSVTGTNYVAALGVRPTTGVVVQCASVSGSATDDWLTNSGSNGPLPVALVGDPDLVVLELGATDAERLDANADIYTRLTTLVTAAQASATVVLGASHAPPTDVLSTIDWTTFVTGLYAVADERDVPIIDWAAAFGLNATAAAAGLLYDYWHPSVAGNAMKGHVLAGLLEPWAAPDGTEFDTAAPRYQSHTVGTFGSGVTSRTANVPSGVAVGDVVLLMLYISGTAAITWPSGFYEAAASPVTVISAPFTHRVAWKRVVGADAGTYGVSWTGAQDAQLLAIRYSGASATGCPIEAANSGTTAGSTTVPALSVTTRGPNRLLVSQTLAYDTISFTPSTGFTERLDASDGITFSDKAQPAAGGSGAVSGTGGSSAPLSAWLGALIPAAGTELVPAAQLQVDGLVAGGNSIWAAGGFETMPRRGLDVVAGSAGRLWLTYFTALADVTIGSLGFVTHSSGSASVTLCRLALFTVTASTSDLVKVAQTANNASLGSGAFTSSSAALSTASGWPSSYALSAGVHYAVGLLQVGGTPSSLTGDLITGGDIVPATSKILAGQTDIADTIADGTLSAHYEQLFVYGVAT